ncbi:ATP-binding cassette domain-containing protein [Pelagicoccus sp. SDUM812003]|uniref:ATP-binding cassette domain-containing protein n=1 Tax=Pelagicoccus sp. SDUM812003 TaxID=3041267 RepID=UPI00280F898D|nr:ATP-binding cassette domain-containing protein [Pelagicoccus sp. SDUM812003]MDQ8201604.1 ATP-binding cassette domain-containing protein [Pelagicoccus sp. SDUM812003]
MPVLSVTELTISFSGPPVIENANLHIDRGERVCVLGRNGAGKSTLLKVISGDYAPNTGSITFPEGGGAAALPQEIPNSIDSSVQEIITLGFGAEGSELLKLHAGQEHAPIDPERQWKMEAAIEKTIKELQLDPRAAFNALSGGMKRRALLGKALVREPSVLILDEPTNHLDLESILWLENYLLGSKLTLLFVTHDRAFLKKLATRIVEVDLGKLNSFRCDYETYLTRKEEMLEIEARNQAAFEKKLSQEEAWLRKGIKARRTRNEGRVKALKKLRAERQSWRTRDGNASFSLQNSQTSGAKVITAKQVSASFDGRQVLRPFDAQIMRGDRIGVIGPNGSGKTTLLKLLLGKLPPTSGEVEHGTKLEIAYFDQMRAQLDDSKTVFDNVADGNETVTVGGKSKHVMSYLQDFLFTPERARASLKILSGGERNRLLLAKLFTQPANLLVLDEPTNDLDAETLELLEELIADFEGTLLLVSHDRDFLENTVTSLLAIDRAGNIVDHPGGYEDWFAKRQRTQVEQAKQASAASTSSRSTWKERKPKFSNRQRAELEALPQRIEQLDEEKESLIAQLADPATYQDESVSVAELKERLGAIEAESEKCYQRWEELETLKESLTDSES